MKKPKSKDKCSFAVVTTASRVCVLKCMKDVPAQFKVSCCEDDTYCPLWER